MISPQDRSRMMYYLKELHDKFTKYPESLCLRNGIAAIEQKLGVPQSIAQQDPIEFINKLEEKMLLIDQTKFPQRGNCFRACLATLLSIDIDKMPPFEEQTDNVWLEAKRWLLTQGLTIRNYHHEFPPKGYSIATGQSPRNANIYYAVVALDGKQYFDPHPDRSGLVSIERYWKIEELESKQQKFNFDVDTNNKSILLTKIDLIVLKVLDNSAEMLEKAKIVARIKVLVESFGGYDVRPQSAYLDLRSICRGNFRNFSIKYLTEIEAILRNYYNFDPWELN